MEENNKSQTEFWKKKASKVRGKNHNFANGSQGKYTPTDTFRNLIINFFTL